MKDRTLYRIWAFLYIVCALLGFIPSAEGFGRALLVMAALLFFVPPALLLSRYIRSQNSNGLRLLRNLAAIWLGVTLVLLVLNFLSAGAADITGQSLYGFLILLSAPMICGQFWVLSLFCWALILSTCMSFLKKFSASKQ